MEALIDEITNLPVPELPEYEPDEVMERGRRRRPPTYEVLDAYQPHAALRRPDVAAPLRVPAARLRRVPDLRRPLQAAAAGHPRPAHRADGRRASTCCSSGPTPSSRRLARLALETGVDGAFVEGRTAGRDRRRARARATPGRAWLDELERIKDPWFNMAIGDGLYHFYGSWCDDPSDPVRLDDRLRPRAEGRRARSSGRPRRSARERDRLAEEYGALLDRRRARDVRRPARPLAHRLPVRRGAQVLLRLLVPDALVEQGARVRRAARTARLPRGRGGRVPARPARGRERARRAAAHVGDRRRPRSARATGRRSSPGGKELLRRLGEWTPPPAIGATPEAITDPAVDHALGRDHAARPGVGAREGGRRRADRRRGVARHGRRARHGS